MSPATLAQIDRLAHDAGELVSRALAAENERERRACATLGLILGVSALEAALLEFRLEGRFPGKPSLGKMLMHSRTALAWLDYATICRTVGLRNECCHAGRTVEPAEAAEALEAIRLQVEAWHDPLPGDYLIDPWADEPL